MPVEHGATLCGRHAALTRGGKRAGARTSRSLSREESGRAMVRDWVAGGPGRMVGGEGRWVGGAKLCTPLHTG